MVRRQGGKEQERQHENDMAPAVLVHVYTCAVFVCRRIRKKERISKIQGGEEDLQGMTNKGRGLTFVLSHSQGWYLFFLTPLLSLLYVG